ncbi:MULTISPECIES: hypothetical protein [Lactococcus]|uniref:hypothetical protein n=1 Tax=Lactococcus TaxID=1357 RepID=UPI0002D61C33|nr:MULTISPECIES: hypothetical protein [Lactococcus]
MTFKNTNKKEISEEVMNIKSKVTSIQAWPVNIKAVEKYISDNTWDGEQWVKDLLDGKENGELKYDGTRYLQVDFDEYKKYPPSLMLNKGASCRDGDYVLRFERGLSEEEKYIYFVKCDAEEFKLKYYIV